MRRLRVFALTALALIGGAALLFWFIFLGLDPIPRMITTHQMAVMEDALSIGERKEAVVARFGPGQKTNDAGVVVYWHNYGGLCWEIEQGVEVTYDLHDRVIAWRGIAYPGGC